MKAYELGLYEKAMPAQLGWKTRLEAAREAGFDFLELSIDETDARLARLDMTQAERGELLALTREVGLPIRSMCLSAHRRFPMGSHDPAIRARSMDIMEKALRLAADLGIRMIQLAGYDVYYEESDGDTRAYFAENLHRAAELAAREGVCMGFETMETELLNTVGKAMAYVRQIDSPYLSVYPDIGNITNAAVRYKTDVLEDLRSGKGHLLAMHLKETLPGVFREVPFGTGHVDFPAAIAAAWSLGVRRYVTEMWYTGNDWKSDIAAAERMMSALLDQRGERLWT